MAINNRHHNELTTQVQEARNATLTELLNTLLRSFSLFFTIIFALIMTFRPIREGNVLNAVIFMGGFLFVSWAVTLYPRMPFKLRAGFFALILYVLIFRSAMGTGTTISNRVLMLLAVLVIMIFFGLRAGVAALILSTIYIVVNNVGATYGFWTFNETPWIWLPIVFFTTIGATLFFTVYKLQSFSEKLHKEQQHIRQDLVERRENLEAGILRQTHALATASDISRQLLTIYERQALLVHVVSSLSEAFNYYHVHAYIKDDEQAVLRMMAGSGEVGTALFVAGHSINMGQGLVGKSALMNLTIYVPDVSKDDNWLPNPLLKETKSEIVVPIVFGDQLIGVLNVQDDQIAGLTQEDVNILETVSLQLGVAWRNAEMYELLHARVAQKIVLNEIVQRIQQTERAEDAVRVATEGLGRYLKQGVGTVIDMGQLSGLMAEAGQEASYVE